MIVDDEPIQINLWTMVILNSYVQEPEDRYIYI